MDESSPSPPKQQTPQPVAPKQNGFDLMDLDIGGGPTLGTPNQGGLLGIQPVSNPVSQGGNDLLGMDFGGPTITPKPAENQNNFGSLGGMGGFDLMDLGLGGATQAPAPVVPTKSPEIQLGGGFDLMDLGLGGGFGGSTSTPVQTFTPATQAPTPSKEAFGDLGFDLLGGGLTKPAPATPSPSQSPAGLGGDFEFDDDFAAPVSAAQNISVFKDSDIEVFFGCRKDSSSQTRTLIDVLFDNHSGVSLDGADILISAAKHLALENFTPQGVSAIQPGSRGVKTHTLAVTNSMFGSKSLGFKIKITYSASGQPRVKEAMATTFPLSF